MLFEDFQAACPEAELIFACLPEYMDAARDHPYIKEVIDSRTVNLNEYCIHYNTCVSIADRYEHNNAPFCLEHRSDIWAKYCGMELARHDMCFRLPPRSIETCRQRLRTLVGGTRTGPIALFAPISKMAVKTLLPTQMAAIKEAVEETQKEVSIVGLHNREVADLTRLGIPGIYQATIKEWMTYIAAADYVIAVDTAAFHMAGGLKKPLVGIFTFADGKAYGKHFDFVLVQKHRDNGDWDCGPCFKFMNCPKCTKSLQKPCLTELSKAELQAGVRAMFDRWPWGKNRISLL
jgi:ADP-heptose:LPS heptosyltransferase